MRLMLRRATYWISGSADSNVTIGGASFLMSWLMKSDDSEIMLMSFISTFTVDSTTAALACARRGLMRSQMLNSVTSYEGRGYSLLGLSLVFRCVVGECVQNKDLTPFRAFVKRREQLVHGLQVDLDQRSSLIDFSDRCNRIGHHLQA